MSDELSPYATPSHSGNIPAMPPAVVPGQIKVLGILHLVFAGIGLVTILVGVVSHRLTESMLVIQEKAGGIQEAQAKISRGIIESSNYVTWFGYISAFVLGVMLLIAGLGLLKRKKAGLSWSNRYAWTSIAFKVINLVLFLTVVLPRVQGMFSEMEKGGREMQMAASIAKMSAIGGGIAGPVVTCVYPILVLVLLNRDSVRKSLI
jgi:hypothetical protein